MYIFANKQYLVILRTFSEVKKRWNGDDVEGGGDQGGGGIGCGIPLPPAVNPGTTLVYHAFNVASFMYKVKYIAGR